MAKSDGRFTDTKRVKELIGLMAENGLTEIELVEDKARISLKRGIPGGGGASLGVGGANMTSMPMVHAPVHTPAAPAAAAEEKFVEIKSPMVGTFYVAANPESDPYVSVGTPVGDDSVVCIIEAMKVFNEIRAE
ncbi:MAG: biotin/lipoyl-containing protein, partial [Phycisphaerae bacterium]